MLRSLYIQNYALIEKLDIDFGSGFSVITGETGAGKSIILGAIGLLLGQRADVKSIRRGAAKCVIEARFEIAGYGMQPFFEENELEYEDECILRREVYASGKSRAFINDTPASLVQMKELGEQLIDVHSQHQNLLLNKEGFQLSVLDLLAHDEDELSKYRSLHREWKQVQQDLELLVAQAEKNKADEDYIRFQLEQLEDAHLAAGEQEELEQEADTLSHAEEIKAGLFRAGQAMNSDEGGLLSVLKECLNTMAGLQKVYPAAGELVERLESSYTLDFVQNDLYYPTFAEKLTYLMYRFCSGHFFNDGNKRIALTLGAYFLHKNNYYWHACICMRTLESIIYHVAASNINQDLLLRIVNSFLTSKDYDEELKIDIANAMSKGELGIQGEDYEKD